jgi:intracellular sulfur oxidation DsrE/DsrF family protein
MPHRTSTTALVLCSLFGIATLSRAQAPAAARTGPTIRGFGAVYDVPAPDLKPAPDLHYKVVFSVRDAGESPSTVNRALDSAARYLNLQASAGVPRDHTKVVVVLHGAAGGDALNNEAYRARFGGDNPNLALLAQLQDAGAEVYLCGQTAAARGLPRTALAPGVKMALSAMTAFSTLALQGYTIMP